MIKALIYLTILACGIAVFFFVLWKIAKLELKEAESNLDVCMKKYDELYTFMNTLKEELRIKSENRKKANEKITALHNGDLSADDILPK